MNQNNFKPKSPLIGADGNIFNLIAIASRSLKDHDLKEHAKEMTDRVMSSQSYEEALSIITEYVEPTDTYDYDHDVFDFIKHE